MSISRVNSLLIALSLLCSCTGHTESRKDADTLNERILNYWNGVDIATMDGDAREQMIVDCLYIMQHTDSATRKAAWDNLNAQLGYQLDRTVADYLGQPDSPLYSVEMFEEYLESLISVLPPDDMSHARAAYLLENIRKNRPGQQIADLGLTTERSTATSLHEIIKESVSDCLILFYDPDCDSCDETISQLSHNATASPYKIIAISVTDTLNPLPAKWISTRITDPDQLDNNFYLPTLPALYTVSPTGLIK